MNQFPNLYRSLLQLSHACLRGRVLGLICGLCVCTPLPAAESHLCASEADPHARLACYDRAFPPATAIPQARQRSEAELKQEFGLSSREVEERKPESEREPAIESIEAVVSNVRSIQGGQRLLILDNGQTWQLTEGGSKGPLSPGDRVSVRRALFGSYILTTPGGIGLRIRRVN